MCVCSNFRLTRQTCFVATVVCWLFLQFCWWRFACCCSLGFIGQKEVIRVSVYVCVCVCRISCCRLSQLLLYFVDNVVIVVVATIVTRQLHYRLNVFFALQVLVVLFSMFHRFFFAFVVVNSLIRSSSAT